MIIEIKEILKRIKKTYPNFQHAWRTDKKYIVFSDEELEPIIEKCSAKHYPFIKGRNECEEFALYLLSNIRQYETNEALLDGIISDDEFYNRAIGMVTGNFYDPFTNNKVHNCNIAICKNNIWIIEPQSDEIMIANSKIFEPFLLWM